MHQLVADRDRPLKRKMRPRPVQIGSSTNPHCVVAARPTDSRMQQWPLRLYSRTGEKALVRARRPGAGAVVAGDPERRRYPGNRSD